jgi:hypothetical protein
MPASAALSLGGGRGDSGFLGGNDGQSRAQGAPGEGGKLIVSERHFVSPSGKRITLGV